MARNNPPDDLQDSGEIDRTEGQQSSNPTEPEANSGEAQANASSVPDDIQDTGADVESSRPDPNRESSVTSEAPNNSESGQQPTPPENIQDAGPGAGDSQTTTPSEPRKRGSEPPREDIQEAGPGAADSDTQPAPPRTTSESGATAGPTADPNQPTRPDSGRLRRRTGTAGGQRTDKTVRGAETLSSDDNRIDRALGDFDEKVTRAGLTVIDVVAQEPGEIGYPNQDNIDISGPSVGGRSGTAGDLDTEITNDLTEGQGLIAEKGGDGFFSTSERELRRKTDARRDLLSGFPEGSGDVVQAVTASEKAGNAAEGVANIPVEAVSQGGAGLLLSADTASEVAINAPEAVKQYGAGEVALTGAEVGGRVAKSTIDQAKENPYETGGELVGGFVAGGAAFKAVEKASDVGRAARLSGSQTVEFEDITSDRAAKTGDLPKFDTDPDGDTARAVREVSEKAAKNPDAVTEKTGGQTLYHGTQDNFGSDIDVGEGRSELPGLFTSPDASTIALSEGRSSLSLSSIKPRLPDTSGNSDRFVGLPGDRVKGIPEGRGSSGYELRDLDTGEQIQGNLGRGEAKAAADAIDNAEVAPDQTTSGYEFLTDDAETGTAYVRPSGERTSELESVFAPDSKFEQTGQVNVQVNRKQIPGTDVDVPFSGRSVQLDTYRRVDGDRQPTDGPDTDTDLDGTTAVDGDGPVVDYDELRSDLRRSGSPQQGSPTVGGGLVGTGTSVVTGRTVDDSPTSPTDSDTAPLATDTSPTPSNPESPTAVSTSGNGGGASSPSNPPETPPTTPPASTPTTPPASTPTTPPASGPSADSPTLIPTSTGSPTAGGPASPPPSSIPGGPSQTSVPPSGPRFDLNADSDEDDQDLAARVDAIDFDNPWASPGEALFGGDLFGGGDDAE